jgi:flagellar basal body-associated protein FliL
MQQDPDQPGKKPAWLLGIYAVVAMLIAAGLVFFMMPEQKAASSPAERTSAATGH